MTGNYALLGNIKEGCNTIDGCSKNECFPSQKCVNVWGDYKCQCRDDKSGLGLLRHLYNVQCTMYMYDISFPVLEPRI